MTTEEKELALWNEARTGKGLLHWPMEYVRDDTSFLALCRAIEAHEADKKAFSDAAARADKLLHRMAKCVNLWSDVRDEIDAARSSLSPFILPEPEPDPLVEIEDPIDALVELLAPVLTHSQGMAARERENRFRNAIAALKAKEADNGKSC